MFFSSSQVILTETVIIMISNLTIPQLKSLIADMNLRSYNADMIVTSKMRKADIVEMIEAEINALHEEALNMIVFFS